MTPYYRICILGNKAKFNAKLKTELLRQLDIFNLKPDKEVEFQYGTKLISDGFVSTVGLFFGDSNPIPLFVRPENLDVHQPIIPIVSKFTHCEYELPNELSIYNAMETNANDSEISIVSAVLECLGLVPKKRKVFISYRRVEKSQRVALQLFERLSANQFSVFLDTHKIRPGEIFQEALWHQLTDSDVMIMLDTEDYFESKWTKEEFAKAGKMGIGILRIGFPDVIRNCNFSNVDNMQLNPSSLTDEKQLTERTVNNILTKVELLRSISVNRRVAKLCDKVNAVTKLTNGDVVETGIFNRMNLKFPKESSILVYPTSVVPDSELIQKVSENANGKNSAIVYDNQLIEKPWQQHLKWMESKVKNFHLLTSEEKMVKIFGRLRNGS